MALTTQTKCKKIVLACRITASTYTLLEKISKHTGLRKSTLVRTAITQWLRNAPQDLPLDLKVQITRANIQDQINTIKNLRWTYHQQLQAQNKLKYIQKEQWLPPYTKNTIKKLESKIIELHKQLDQWIKDQNQKGEKA